MKKWLLWILILIMLLIPIYTNAYASKVIPGGENIGIYIKDKGITVIGFYNNKNTDLNVGDQIIAVNDITVNTIDDLVATINSEVTNNQVKITYLRSNKKYETILHLDLVDNIYKTGLYVKDSITGIGTLTYIDPESYIFGSLGHEVVNSNTKKRVVVDNGYIFKSKVTSIRKSSDGNPGGKIANFNQNIKYGNISKNTQVGIYGTYDSIPQKELIDVASNDEIRLGKATILTTLKDNTIKEYEIEIKKINDKSIYKNLYFEIVDDALIKDAGGIVQGMSGSPIIQNNKLIGAVTHVIIDNVKTGYGVFITTMLKEGER